MFSVKLMGIYGIMAFFDKLLGVGSIVVLSVELLGSIVILCSGKLVGVDSFMVFFYKLMGGDL